MTKRSELENNFQEGYLSNLIDNEAADLTVRLD